MRVAFFLFGFVSAVTAATITVTETTDITITSCAPTVTNCPAKSASQWENVSVQPTPAVTKPADWQEWSSVPAPCPAYTATAPPDWFSILPEPAYSSVAAKWTGGPPSDWCYYSYSNIATKTTPAPYYPTGAPTSRPVGTGGYKPSTTSTYPKYTGAANNNAGSVALAGLAAAAALVLA